VTADLVLLGGSIYTVDPTRPRAEAVAVVDGRVGAVGSDAEIRGWIGPGTEVLELEGRTVLPGFQDAHIHFAHGGMAARRCNLFDTTTPSEHAGVIVDYASRNQTVPWIVGGGWSMDDFGGRMPTVAFLDALIPGRPVALGTRDAHTLWVNSRALELAGVTSATPDPIGGAIDRDGTGAPAGTLQETAMRLVEHLVPDPSPMDWEQAILEAQSALHALGITACQEASLDEELFEPYRSVAGRGALTMRTEGNLYWSDDRGHEQLDELLIRRERGTVGRLRIRGAKLFQDGVVESSTAAMLDPYRDARAALRATSGASLFDPERLRRIVELLDAHGFQVHIHTIGDRAVREALDAFEAAARANGRRDSRHHLAHVQFLSRDDVPRFAALGVAANVTPYWAVLSGYVRDLTLPFVSPEAGGFMYPFGSILGAGGRLAFGSDWTVSTPDPLLQLEVATTRKRPDSSADDAFLPEQCLTLEEAIAAATLGSAYVNHLDAETGSIEPGKLADLVILDRDLFDRGAGAIGEARVEATLLEGKTVFAT
jgi:predicted amidohydrolase YtcJ